MEIQREFSWPQRGTPQWRLLNDFQREFPLSVTPFFDLGRELHLPEAQIISQLKEWSEQGVVTRLGAVFRPQALGPSTLAAVRVAPAQVEKVAGFINSFEEVNHNYEREGELNLWFVVTAPSEARLQEILLAIGERAGNPVVDCRLVYEYRIDLGFDLSGPAGESVTFVEGVAQGPAELSAVERALCERLEPGLPLNSRPFDRWADELGITPEEVSVILQGLLTRGVIRRMGVIVRHRPLGYQANAMVVWQCPLARTRELGRALARQPFVTLCYERQTSPEWPYNLYCMIHGRSRSEVLLQVESLVSEFNLTGLSQRVLFSTRAFKQRGSRYLATRPPSAETPASAASAPHATTSPDAKAVDAVLIQELQKGLAVIDRPFFDLAARLGMTEEAVCQRLTELRAEGLLTRFGPMYNIEKLGGTFSLVAMEVPRERWEEVVDLVNRFPEVAHNYEREHRLNMWMVVAALLASQLAEVLNKIEQATGLKPYSMPKLKEFYLNLQLEVSGD